MFAWSLKCKMSEKELIKKIPPSRIYILYKYIQYREVLDSYHFSYSWLAIHSCILSRGHCHSMWRSTSYQSTRQYSQDHLVSIKINQLPEHKTVFTGSFSKHKDQPATRAQDSIHRII